jgi:hypothetical protein
MDMVDFARKSLNIPEPEALCHYCGKPCDNDFTVGLADGLTDKTVFAHEACWNKSWKRAYAEIEADYQAGCTDWHVVNGKIERRAEYEQCRAENEADRRAGR